MVSKAPDDLGHRYECRALLVRFVCFVLSPGSMKRIDRVLGGRVAVALVNRFSPVSATLKIFPFLSYVVLFGSVRSRCTVY